MSLSNHRRSAALTRRLVCVIAAVAVAAASCSSMHKVPVVRTSAGQPIAWQVKAGDAVRVTVRDGGVVEFTVQNVTPDAIIASDGTRYEHTSIQSVERRGFSAGKTAGAVGVGASVIVIAITVAASAAILSIFAGGGALD